MKVRKGTVLLICLVLVPFSLWSAYHVLVLHINNLEETFPPQHRFRSSSGSSLENEVVSASDSEHDDDSRPLAMKDDKNRLHSLGASPESNSPVAPAVSSNSYNGDDDRPLFILHAGPPKTGTTTIQWFAAEHSQLLEQDNIYFLGNYKRSEIDVHHLCFACIREKEDECRQRWKELERTLDYHYKEKHHVLISDENFSRFGTTEDEYLWKYLIPMLNKNEWRVKILFTYRRYYEWIPSWYYEYYNPNGARGKKRKRFLLWPESRSRAIPSFSNYFADFMQESYDMVSSVSNWKEHFDDVQILNMHNGHDYVETFFCDMIPQAKRFCSTVRKKQQEKSDSSTRNQSANKNLHFDMLAVEAHMRGWIKDSVKISRTQVRKAVEKHSQKLGYTSLQDFDLKCMSKEQTDTLFISSKSLESELVPEFYKQKGEKELKAGFAKAMQSNKFCSIDINATLQDGRFQKFFTSLHTIGVA